MNPQLSEEVKHYGVPFLTTKTACVHDGIVRDMPLSEDTYSKIATFIHQQRAEAVREVLEQIKHFTTGQLIKSDMSYREFPLKLDKYIDQLAKGE